jgi:hypothetical protein
VAVKRYKGSVEDVRKRLEKMKRNIYKDATPQVFGADYFYVFGWTKAGKVVSYGPFASQHEADSELAILEDGEVFHFATRDLSKATREIKAELLRRGVDPDEALKKMLHKREE